MTRAARTVAAVAALAGLTLAGLSVGQDNKDEKKAEKKPKLGYTDTPQLPNSKYRVHDGERPQPPAVVPGSFSTNDVPGKPPADAVVLFDGSSLAKWKDGKGNTPSWTIENGAAIISKGGGSISTRDEFGDCQLHIEWSAPNPPRGRDQGRGNSGVYLMNRYEVQVLDSYDNLTYADGHAGAIYGQSPPLSLPLHKPGEWNVYDIVFTAPRFKDGKLERPGFITVLVNGVCVQANLELLGATLWRALPKYTPHGAKGPITLQDHGDPVRFRNIWVRELKRAD
jgi:hypothetical protein